MVASERSVEWDVSGPREFNVGEPTSLEVKIVNTGNVRLTHTLQVAGPKGWQISSDDIDAPFDLEAGQYDSIELTILASQASTGELLLWLSNANEVEDSSITLSVSSSGVINDDSSSESETSNVIGVLGLLIIAFLVGLVILQVRSKLSSEDFSQQQVSKISPDFTAESSVNSAENNREQELKEYQEQAEKYAQYQTELAEYEQSMERYEEQMNQSADGTEKTAENGESEPNSENDEALTDSDES